MPSSRPIASRSVKIAPMALYESEITKFLRSLKEQRPHLEDAQQSGRRLLWDRDPLDLDQLQRAQEIRVKQKPYVYQPD